MRVGVLLWVLSWVPYGIILGLSGAAFTIAWAVEVLLGLAGLSIGGAEFARAIKAKGWRGAPRVAWHAMLHGKDVDEVAEAPTVP